ncbi:hypothetical protein RJ640_006896 [Escallonia rubra]|uniref:Uncharacterized protein n=1 Tax=Escallonia rubra TaxID=112253 RepID=A0AA88UL62_9ASTE|nr:hypothetical protein RJ640_006896 [Escallonia rubra]
MGVNPITILAKRAIRQLSDRRFTASSGVWTQSKFILNQLQCRALVQSPRNSIKTGNCHTTRPFYVFTPRHLYSSVPSSSNKKMGFLTWYLGLLESRPILTKSVSSCLIYAAADLTSQLYKVQQNFPLSLSLGESVGEIAARLKRDLIPTMMTGLLYWPMCDFFTYKIIPIHLQSTRVLVIFPKTVNSHVKTMVAKSN